MHHPGVASGWSGGAPRSRLYPTSGRPRPPHDGQPEQPVAARPSSSICIRVTSARRLTLPQPIARSSSSRLRRTIERPNRRASLLPAAPSGVGQSGLRFAGAGPSHAAERGQDSNATYERTGRGLESPSGSQTRRSRSIADPSHHAAFHGISAVTSRSFTNPFTTATMAPVVFIRADTELPRPRQPVERPSTEAAGVSSSSSTTNKRKRSRRIRFPKRHPVSRF